MPLGLRIRVTWDDDVVQDEVFLGRRPIQVGAGEKARAAATGWPDRLVTFRRSPNGFVMEVPGGAVDGVEIPGEDPVGHDALAEGWVRPLRAHESGRLTMGDSAIDFELVRVGKQHSLLENTFLWMTVGGGAAACLGLLVGFGVALVHQRGDGNEKRWGEVTSIGAAQARHLRVQVGPNGPGASRLALGDGKSLRGLADSLLVPRARKDARPSATTSEPAAKNAGADAADGTLRRHRPRKRPSPAPSEPSLVGAAHPSITDPTMATATSDGDAAEDEDGAETSAAEAITADATAERKGLVDKGQQALLAAELRASVESLTSAEKIQPLDYDNLNWLGLAHFFLGDYVQAEARWTEARALDATRSDAVNNLGGIARRKGDLDGEVALYHQALALHPGDCHALNSLALSRAKQRDFLGAITTLAASDTACGGDYAYTYIQRAGILALQGNQTEAMSELEKGLAKVDTLVPIKEYEVEADLLLDPAFASLRTDTRFARLTGNYLPRASQSKDQILSRAKTANLAEASKIDQLAQSHQLANKLSFVE